VGPRVGLDAEVKRKLPSICPDSRRRVSHVLDPILLRLEPSTSRLLVRNVTPYKHGR
jgi:hypothetical protein